jgi:ketosteroid isomerase-like protein
MGEQTTVIGRAARNAELLAAGYAAFGRGDLGEVQALFHPNLVWHAYRLGQLGGDHVGWEAVQKFFVRTMQLTNATFNLEIHEILANDDGAAAVVQSRAQRDGATLDSRQIQHFRIVDEKVVEVWQFVDDAEAVGAFWA